MSSKRRPGYSSHQQHLPDYARERLLDLRRISVDSRRNGFGKARTEETREFEAYLAALVEKGRWTLTCLSKELGITREAVRQKVDRILGEGIDVSVIDVPIWERPVKVREYKRPRVAITPAQKRELRRLQKLASQLRGGVNSKGYISPERIASEKLSAMLAQLVESGVYYIDLARALDVQPITIRARLSRHGYRNNPASQPAYMGAQIHANKTIH